MVNIIDYLQTSKECDKPLEQIEKSNFLKDNYFGLREKEKKSLLNLLIISNFCYAFKKKPIVYEQITQYIADRFTLHKTQIVLVGSAKTGFAIDPQNYGREFSEKSDLDFAIINREVFDKCVDDYNLWKMKNSKDEYTDADKKNYKFWNDNINELKHNIKRGFIDTYKIPNFLEFKTTQSINNSLSLIVINLRRIHDITVKEASVRVYKDWNTFETQLKINIEHVLKKL
ncbi:hypothetical protein [Flavobacterium pectinovorum]|uniref:hypothetical protein n=1 Tax=Flavobacterium pectinovorum TaxID=29533 RepID=UPI001FAE3EA9|nr:hypothetical protein [Flavobacterium pectinovorum]MCI9844547.1 hypothetical protein [Flavobacterium pectinovorum]